MWFRFWNTFPTELTDNRFFLDSFCAGGTFDHKLFSLYKTNYSRHSATLTAPNSKQECHANVTPRRRRSRIVRFNAF
jgi:hypothetical protein